MHHEPDDLKIENLKKLCATAILDGAQWSHLLHELEQHLDATGVVLFTPDPQLVSQFGVASGDVAEGVGDYFLNWVEHDAWNRAVQGTGFFSTAGEVRVGQEFITDDALRRSDFFNGWARHYRSEQVMSLKVEDGSDGQAPAMHLSVFRRLCDTPYSDRDKRIVRALYPDLRKAARIHWALHALASLPEQVAAMVTAMPRPVWLLCPDLRIEFCNPAAERVMREGLAAVRAGSRLQRLGELDATKLEQLVRSASGSALHTVPVARAQGLARATLHVTPMREAPAYAKAWPGACALLMLEEPPDADQESRWLAILAERYRLTPIQVNVLHMLGEGLTAEEIATRRSITLGTVRNHVHQLLSRTGLKRQHQLVRLALGK